MMPLVYRPGYVWENGEWRRETPEEARSEVQPMAARAEPGSDEPAGGDAPRGGGDEGARKPPIGESRLRDPGADAAGSEEPAVGPPGDDPRLRGPGEPRPFPVPAHKKEIVPQEAMDRFLGRHADAEANMFKALGEIFAAEGGFKADKASSAFAGITDPALEDAKKFDEILKDYAGKAKDMNEDQTARAYEGYMKSVLKRYGGVEALETIKDPKTAAAFADTLFMHGGNGGAHIIKEATNAVIDRISTRVQDQVGGSVLPPAEPDRKGGTSGPKDKKLPSKAARSEGHPRQRSAARGRRVRQGATR